MRLVVALVDASNASVACVSMGGSPQNVWDMNGLRMSYLTPDFNCDNGDNAVRAIELQCYLQVLYTPQHSGANVACGRCCDRAKGE